MALVKTTRLNLAKQDAGDSPGSWDSAQNDGMDDADARFFLEGILEPNDGAGTDSNFIGQRFYDSVTGLWWTSTEIASPSVLWVSDLTTLDAAITHPTPATSLPADYPHHHINAVLEWLSVTEVQLRPLAGDIIYYDALGVRVTMPAGVFIFDMTTDREVPQSEAANTAWYLYIDNDTVPGTPEPIISLTPPDPIGDNSNDGPGYHPTLTDHRCVGSIWNDSGSDIAKFTMDRGGMVVYDGISRDHSNHTIPLTLAAQSAYRNQVVNIPLTASHMLLSCFLEIAGVGGYMAFAQDGATTTGLPNDPPPHLLSDTEFVEAMLILQERQNDFNSQTLLMPITNPLVPAFNYGHFRTTAPQTSNVTVLGYIDIWAPKI